MSESIVSIIQTPKIEYSGKSTNFRPSNNYPEYPFREIADKTNYVYDAVRENFHLQKFDVENYGTDKWNPLKEFITPGNCILIKPNLVMDKNKLNGNVECLYTQPAVVAAVLDYILIALGNTGSVIIGDAPMQECDFHNLLVTSGYKELVQFYREKKFDVTLVDFRELTSKVINGLHMSTINDKSEGKIIDLGEESEFYGVDSHIISNMRITNYNPEILPQHHNERVHEYYISDYVLKADVIINMPKPKTHRKAGVTISLKNFVGVNIRKEYLPHHTKGSIYENGDEYYNKSLIHTLRSNLYDHKNCLEFKRKYIKAKFLKYLIKCCSILLKLQRNKYSEGSWYGNNTISKTVSDINKIVNYVDKNGTLHDTVQKKILIVADMIKAGENEGPVLPSCKECGIIAVGTNPVCFDETIATLMGFDYQKIPVITNARNIKGKYKIVNDAQEAHIISNVKELNNKDITQLKNSELFNFIPTSGWKNHIEL